MDKLNSILLVAGTHGNELSGIYLNKLISDGLFNATRSSFDTHTVLANHKAIENNVRYLDVDLNRQFSPEVQANEPTNHEQTLAREFIEKYGDVNNQLIIDLHNTTSNMGATLILLTNDPFYTKMGAYVKQQMPEANILFEDRKPWQEQAYLCTAGQYGVMIEVGAQAHGSLKSETLALMKKMVTAVFDYVEKHNLDQVGALSDYDAYYYTEEVYIPMDEDGMRRAMVHPDVCGKDFQAVAQGQPLLTTFDGEEICWQQAQDTYPHFINEAAYFKSHIAMALADKKKVEV
ncbi:aspartoacylase [Vibrio sp. SCSIO 43136]|uniref:aspartoacylase n=1 Tax=Vibrio sp. SCSIO 43136 TaxID=2819101 RepID=UPI002074D2E2|nr:aspartoacylase [Vibrio sp. SCSIO 43136]USD66991.1 aspartoacylase [Vibrio sp. SCSIO 43136]